MSSSYRFSSDQDAKAELLIRKTGHRLTESRRRVLGLLLRGERALSHTEIEEALANDEPIDRVTLYRVLDWLVERQLAHKIAGDDRVWRFRVGADDVSHHHAHFKCGRCHRVFCLEDVSPAVKVQLPDGYLTEEVEVTVKGVCADCK
ncbi:Fur family ferric uptake transcriptional regulator [Chitinivorax tropicus]|uniref:Fur family ferric uptake transcriptional regulator n=1 Tax=Chitinivorax tropicus TaxID=714531 RepID=A0A840MF81_9PROT|nr:transcriptional repressor [Chitinivorax tropicus]MBB5017924.1 Fur family ferric uptake transcriptional regulator [Chitinivorax tropicus]